MKKKAPARKSKVNPAMEKFMTGKKTGGKRTSTYTAKPPKKTKKAKYGPSGGMIGKSMGAIKKRRQRQKKI